MSSDDQRGAKLQRLAQRMSEADPEAAAALGEYLRKQADGRMAFALQGGVGVAMRYNRHLGRLEIERVGVDDG